jgi:hypothetical protein
MLHSAIRIRGLVRQLVNNPTLPSGALIDDYYHEDVSFRSFPLYLAVDQFVHRRGVFSCSRPFGTVPVLGNRQSANVDAGISAVQRRIGRRAVGVETVTKRSPVVRTRLAGQSADSDRLYRYGHAHDAVLAQSGRGSEYPRRSGSGRVDADSRLVDCLVAKCKWEYGLESRSCVVLDLLKSIDDARRVALSWPDDDTGWFLLISVIVPSILGIVCRQIVGRERVTASKVHLKLANSAILLFLNYTNASVSLPQAISNPDWDFLAVTLGITFLLCVVAFFAGWVISRLRHSCQTDQIALMFGLGMNNNGTGLVLASMALADHPQVLLPIIFYNLVQHLVAGTVDTLIFQGRTPDRQPNGVEPHLYHTVTATHALNASRGTA